MADLLSAASLLLTVLGVVYGTWYSEIMNVLGETIPARRVDRGQVRGRVGGALKAKGLPLTVAAFALTVLFLPDALRIAIGGIRSFWTQGLSAFCEYNAVKAAFCLVVVLTGALAGYLVQLVRGLKAKLGEIDGPDR
jgi:hypothetical protein